MTLRSLAASLAFAATTALLTASAEAKAKISPADKALLQASMFQYIDRQTIEGTFLHLDQKTGQIRKLVPEKAHPMIFKMGDYFVLCSDFRDDAGKQINVDFFMAKRGNAFVVFDQLIDNRDPVTRLYEAGKAVDVE